MNTPAHMLVGAALFGRRDRPRTIVMGLAGGLVPDISMLVLVGWSVWIEAIPAREVFSRLCFTEAWQRAFAIDHSFLVWGALAALAIRSRMAAATAFAGAGLVHAAVDFLLHNGDARRQFWPVSEFAFQSPVSYWDPARYGAIVAPLEAALVLALTVLLV
ncbi:cobalamin biosynthesis protein CobQ [Defluviimonas salinarum]|uniref:Cobalamin biosynthesis protein CobQ n=1 Tax=Defluviimonas salinarum TaxID=2992147 RepID=A0ABT3J5C1_9RHOB|nr:cobalamin biosynthesis protein CobQ [Defluviimonas salinarum]MCW3782865.1 cobalamin biosynthesis protein CobQ [Defluviimonas salinarum]